MADGTSVVIGATSGIGLAGAELLASRGDEVVVASRDVARAEKTASALGSSVSAVGPPGRDLVTIPKEVFGVVA